MNRAFESFLTDKKIEGVIFDMDGTLLDSMNSWFLVTRKMLAEMGKQPLPGFEKTLKSLERRDISSYLIDAYQLDCSPTDISNYILRDITEEYERRVPSKPYALEHMLELKQAGFPVCVCTGCHQPLCDLSLSRLGFLEHLEFLLTPADVGGVRKEFPDIYQEAARRLDMDPARCLVYEDTLLCVQTARGAGFPVVGVYDQASEHYQKDIQKLSNLYIHSYQELL